MRLHPQSGEGVAARGVVQCNSNDIQKFITSQDAWVEMNRLDHKDKAKELEAVMRTVLWHFICIPLDLERQIVALR